MKLQTRYTQLSGIAMHERCWRACLYWRQSGETAIKRQLPRMEPPLIWIATHGYLGFALRSELFGNKLHQLLYFCVFTRGKQKAASQKTDVATQKRVLDCATLWPRSARGRILTLHTTVFAVKRHHRFSFIEAF